MVPSSSPTSCRKPVERRSDRVNRLIRIIVPLQLGYQQFQFGEQQKTHPCKYRVLLASTAGLFDPERIEKHLSSGHVVRLRDHALNKSVEPKRTVLSFSHSGQDIKILMGF